MALLIAAVWAFGGLLEEVLDNATLVRWDETAHRWLDARTTPAGTHAFSVLTQFGAPVPWVVATVVVVGLAVRRQRLLALTWLFAMLGGLALEKTLKTLIHRHRPEYAGKYLHGASYSFPSAHTMMAAICYLLLAWTVVTANDLRGAQRAAAYGAALLLVAVVGFSRLYLGVHYPSDVAGGLAAGIGWLSACVSVVHIVRFRRARDA